MVQYFNKSSIDFIIIKFSNLIYKIEGLSIAMEALLVKVTQILYDE